MMLEVLTKWIQLQRSQWMTKNELSKLQAARINRVVNDAFRKVPFYHTLYQGTGVASRGLLNVSGTRDLPIVTKAQFKSMPLQQRTAIDANLNSCLINTTSGSTGPPITVLEDSYSAVYRDALNLRLMWAYGMRPLDRICRVRLGLRPELKFSLADKSGVWGFFRRRLHKTLLSDTDILDHLRFVAVFRPALLIASASYCRALVRTCEEQNEQLPSFRVVITTGELSDSSTRKLIENKFGAEVFDHYGIEEIGSIAWECPTHSGYHVNTDSLFSEVLRDEERVGAGESGELHVTSFHNMATPIIRYSTGDLATLMEDDCSCGRGLSMIRDIQGRMLDFVLTTDRRYISPMALIDAFATISGIEQFRIIQEKDFSIEVFIKQGDEKKAGILKEAQQCCRALFGETPVSVRLIDRLDNPNGKKFRAIESRLTASRPEEALIE
jgi:phenylacetate-CoA ligase